jgi:hypothetical protein
MIILLYSGRPSLPAHTAGGPCSCAQVEVGPRVDEYALRRLREVSITHTAHRERTDVRDERILALVHVHRLAVERGLHHRRQRTCLHTQSARARAAARPERRRTLGGALSADIVPVSRVFAKRSAPSEMSCERAAPDVPPAWAPALAPKLAACSERRELSVASSEFTYTVRARVSGRACSAAATHACR